MEPQDRQNLAVLVVVGLLIAGALLVLHFYAGSLAMEKCRMEGRRDCEPLPAEPN